jgi:hypothetical protein
VVGDDQAVFLVDQAAGFAWRRLPFSLPRGSCMPEPALEGAGGRGVQAHMLLLPVDSSGSFLP